MSDGSSDGYFGQQGLFTDNSDENLAHFVAEQTQAKIRTAHPVKIVAIHGGGVGAPPTVDVQLLVNQIDGAANPTPHGVVYGIPVLRNHSASGAIINDPVVGDVGHIVISDRDISTVKANAGAQSNPGSFRMHDLADGVWHGAILNPGAPKQYVFFKPGGGIQLLDQFGNVIETFSDHIGVTPVSGGTVYLGGDGSQGTYDFVQTVSAPSTNVKARIG